MQHLSFGVNLVGTFQSEKGIGVGVRALASAMESVKIPISLVNYHDPHSINGDKTFTHFTDRNPYLVNLLHLNPEVIPSFASQRGKEFFKNRYNIAFWNWELEQCPEEWSIISGYFHEIWVPSAYTQKSIEKISKVPVRRIPYPVVVPDSVPQGISRQTFSIPEEKMVFLFAFDFQSCRQRKNPEAVIQAFKRAFRSDEPVLLILKTIHHEKDPEGVRLLRSLAEGADNIRFIDTCLSRSEMYALTKLCDVFVSLHRSEGFGLNIFEAMAMQKPLVATGYSSNMDYMDEANSFPVDFTLETLQKDYGPYRKGSFWAEPSISDAAQKLRFLYEHPEERKKKAQLAAATLSEHLQPEKVGRQISNALDCMIKNAKPTSYFPSKLLSFTDLRSHADISHFPMKSTQKEEGALSLFLKKALRWFLRPSLDKQTELNLLLMERMEEMQDKIDALEKTIKG